MPEPVVITSVRRFLVTADFGRKMDMWELTCGYANWIEGRENGDRETWLVTCFAQAEAQFLEAAVATGVTVEEIHGADETETYALRVGEPGSGWNAGGSDA